MAKVEISAGIGAIHGKVGEITFYTRNGQQEMMPAKRTFKIRDKRSAEQMTHRIKTGNVLNLYRNIKEFLDDNFEGVFGGKNKSTFFRKYNYVLRAVMLDKMQNAQWQCVLAPYVVSNGKLPSVQYEYKDRMYVSDIQIGDLEITDSMEVGTLAGSICKNNEYWANKDSLKIILLQQSLPDDFRQLSTPRCSAIDIILDKSNREQIGSLSLLEAECKGQRIELCNSDGYLAVKADDNNTFACALIHTKGSGQTLSASTQSLLLSNTTLYDYYTADEASAISFSSYKTEGYKG